MSAAPQPSGTSDAAAAAAPSDAPKCAKFMLHVDKQLRALKSRMLLRLDQGARLDRGAAESGERWRTALTAAPLGSYGRPGPALEGAARELERLVLGSLVSGLLGSALVLPMLASSLHNTVRRRATHSCPTRRQPHGSTGNSSTSCGAMPPHHSTQCRQHRPNELGHQLVQLTALDSGQREALRQG
jgi:hypothetical protein